MLLLNVTGFMIVHGIREIVFDRGFNFDVLVHGMSDRLQDGNWGSMMVHGWNVRVMMIVGELGAGNSDESQTSDELFERKEKGNCYLSI